MTTLTTEDLELVRRALEDAEEHRLEHQDSDFYCADCNSTLNGTPCEDHLHDERLAAQYRTVLERLAAGTPEPKLEIRELSPRECSTLRRQLQLANLNRARLRVTWDGGLKVKVGEGTWTRPLGTVE
jgi:hypothetical protein